jgi:integrase
VALTLRGKTWWCNFRLNGEKIQKPTGHSSRRKALEWQEDLKSELRKEADAHTTKAKKLGVPVEHIRRCAQCEELFGFGAVTDPKEKVFCGDDCEEKWRRRQAPVPTLAVFLKDRFLPFVEETHKAKPATLKYYRDGAARLTTSDLGTMRLDKITNEHAQQFARASKRRNASTINLGLRTLRRAINLGNEWGVTSTRPKIALARGEKQRDRVLTNVEVKVYLSACEQPWRDCAVILLATGCRPSEALGLAWERVRLTDDNGMKLEKPYLQIAEGKSKSARRTLPLVPAAWSVLHSRWLAADKPKSGWVFPADTEVGHIEGGSAKNYHGRALVAIADEAKEKKTPNPVKPFPPYTMRHTALTRLAEAGCDAFTLAKIAGHSSISITMRYIHSQREAIDLAFSRVTTSLTTLEISANPQLPLSR